MNYKKIPLNVYHDVACWAHFYFLSILKAGGNSPHLQYNGPDYSGVAKMWSTFGR